MGFVNSIVEKVKKAKKDQEKQQLIEEIKTYASMNGGAQTQAQADAFKKEYISNRQKYQPTV